MRTHIVVTCHQCGPEWATWEVRSHPSIAVRKNLKTTRGKCGASTKIVIG